MDWRTTTVDVDALCSAIEKDFVHLNRQDQLALVRALREARRAATRGAVA